MRIRYTDTEKGKVMKKLARKAAIVIIAVCLLFTAVLVCACSTTESEDGSVTITYNTGENASSVKSLSAKPGSKIYPPADPVRDGYRFDCWKLNGETFVFDVMPEKSITLIAEWKKLYTISFDTGEGASTVEAVQFAEGDSIDISKKIPTRTGYKFGGWERENAAFDLTIMPSENITLTATWKTAYTITFKTDVAGLSVSPIVEEAGKSITPPVIKRDGWHVTKWLNNGVEFKFNKMPSENVTLTAVWTELTNLPSMFVELSDKNGNTFPLANVDRENYVSSRITLTNTEDDYRLDYVQSEFRGRGNGSWTSSGDKKGYKIKFNKKQSLFGRAKNKHWVVIACANFNDVTMNRNYLAYNMAGELFDGIEYSTEAHWIDLYVNNEYRGVYLLCEHVRVGDGRVDIESEYGVKDTGYLVEYDAYATGEEGVDYFRVNGLQYAFTVKSPDPEDYMAEGGLSKAEYMQQVAHIKNYISQVYSAALAKNYDEFANLVDINSFVDMYILHELFKNLDTGYSSFYLYKKPGADGKLYAGPPWDFDATTNFDATDRGDRSPEGIFVADHIRDDNQHCASELYISLYQTTGFKNAVKARWKVLSPKISDFIADHMNDDVYNTYKAAMGKNFALWKGKSQTTAENDWINDMKALKKWLNDRIAWLDNEWR